MDDDGSDLGHDIALIIRAPLPVIGRLPSNCSAATLFKRRFHPLSDSVACNEGKRCEQNTYNRYDRKERIVSAEKGSALHTKCKRGRHAGYSRQYNEYPNWDGCQPKQHA